MDTYPTNWQDAPFVQFAVPDIDGILRTKTLTPGKLKEAEAPTVGFCDVVVGWDIADRVYTHLKEKGHRGFPDARATLDMQTGRMLTMGEKRVPFFLADFSRDPGPSRHKCPRTLLAGVAQQAQQMGYTPRFGGELEWLVFEETPVSIEKKNWQGHSPLSPGMCGYSGLRLAQFPDYWQGIWERCDAARLPLEGIHTETGPGVYEAALLATTVLEAADRVALFKHLTKAVSLEQGRVATFMAKYAQHLPGCGGHLHQSLWDEGNSHNLFQQEDTHPPAILQQYLAGQLACLPALMPMFAPTINSYKRLVGGDWAPRTATWGYDNRTTALRVIGLSGTAARVENRVPGADANPYLAMAASLAAGLYGIKNQLSLTQAASLDSGYDGPPLPLTLSSAVEAMEASEIPYKLFGEAFVAHFIQTRKEEVAQYHRQVSSWERQRYMELI